MTFAINISCVQSQLIQMFLAVSEYIKALSSSLNINERDEEIQYPPRSLQLVAGLEQ